MSNIYYVSRDIYEHLRKTHFTNKLLGVQSNKSLFIMSYILSNIANKVTYDLKTQNFSIYRNELIELYKKMNPKSSNNTAKSAISTIINKLIEYGYFYVASKGFYDTTKSSCVTYQKYGPNESLMILLDILSSDKTKGYIAVDVTTIQAERKITNNNISYKGNIFSSNSNHAYQDLTNQLYDKLCKENKNVPKMELYKRAREYISNNVQKSEIISNSYSVIESCTNLEYERIYFEKLYSKSVLSHKVYIICDDLKKLIKEVKEKEIKRILKFISKHCIDNKYFVTHYFKSEHGRYYAIGPSLQYLPKKYRDKVLSEYTAVDINAATYSILRNYAREHNISDVEIPTIIEYVKDKKTFRDRLYQELKQEDDELEYDYIKYILNAIAFGANINEIYILNDIKTNKNKSIPVQASGWTNISTPLNIVAHPLVKNLQKEISYILKIVSENHKEKNGKKTCLINSCNQKLELSRKISRGKKLAHLYQSIEADILLTLANYEIDGEKLLDKDGAIGLLLHDGLYIKTELYERIGTDRLTDLIKEKLNYTITMETE